jgi:hypothetical protein
MDISAALAKAKAIAAKLKRPAADDGDDEVYNPEKFKKLDVNHEPGRYGLASSTSSKSFEIQVLSRIVPSLTGRNNENLRKIESSSPGVSSINIGQKGQEYCTVTIIGDGRFIFALR